MPCLDLHLTSFPPTHVAPRKLPHCANVPRYMSPHGMTQPRQTSNLPVKIFRPAAHGPWPLSWGELFTQSPQSGPMRATSPRLATWCASSLSTAHTLTSQKTWLQVGAQFRAGAVDATRHFATGTRAKMRLCFVSIS